MSVITEEILIYGVTGIFCLLVVLIYLRNGKKDSQATKLKVDQAKIEGRFEPVSLHPYIDLDACIGSGACIKACPEEEILGIVDGKATVINASSCIGHGACFHACPVEAISLRIGTETRGVDLPHVKETYETNMQGIFIAGELGGMGLIKNSVEQGRQAVDNIAKSKKTKIAGIHDLVIIGAGPAGISGALTAKQHDMDCVILDQNTLGGTVSTFPRSKIVMTSPMELPLYGKVKLHDTSKAELLNIWNDALGKNQITIRENTKVERIVPLEDGSFKVITALDQVFHTNHVLIAIGRRGSPKKLGRPGEETEKVTYKLIEPERISQKKILVVGGGDSAIEAALMLMDDNQVTLSYRKSHFSRIKIKNQQRIQEAIDQKKISMYYNSNLVSIETHQVLLQIDENTGETIALENDMVFILIGGELPTGFLKNSGIEITKRFGQIVRKH